MSLPFQLTRLPGQAMFPVRQWRLPTHLLRQMVLLVLAASSLSLATLHFAVSAQAAQLTPRPATTSAAASTLPCTPFGTIPSPTAVSMTRPGLIQQIDQPTTYQVHGRNHAAIAAQLRHCAPMSDDGSLFSGDTSYWLGTHYSYRAVSDSYCALTDVTVALHISQVLPSWHDQPASSSLTSRWNKYAQALVTHENGHAVIDSEQAQQLLNDLQNMPAASCDEIAADADSLTQARLNTLMSANNDYDSATNHGATQGALW